MLKRLSVVLIVMIMTFGLLPASAAGANDEIKVTYNNVRVNFDTPPVIRNDRTLVPLRAIAEAMGIPIEWIDETKSIFYFNNEGIGHHLYINNPKVEIGRGAGLPLEYVTIDAPPVIINNRTFVPLRFIAESFDVKVDWDANTRTVIIRSGNIPDKPTSAQVDYLGKSYTIYAIPGTGEYKGWRQLKGFPDENILNVYFKYDNNTTFYETKYVGKYANDLKKSVTWTDPLGRVHVTTIGELFSIQTDIGDSAVTKMEEMYGDMYEEWYTSLTIDYAGYVDIYLTAIGEKKSMAGGDNPFGYTHDEDLVKKLNNNKVNIDFNGKSYEVYSIPSDNDWRQLKGFYGEDYFDLFFYPNKNTEGWFDGVLYKAVPKDKYDLNKDITWIGLDYKTYKSKIDIYNTINYTLTEFRPSILEYYTDSSKANKPLDIVSQDDEALYNAWSYIYKEQYKYFITEYLAQNGINVSIPDIEYSLDLENFISRKVTADEMLMLLENYISPTNAEISEFLASNPNNIKFDEIIWKKMAELDAIDAKMRLKKENPEQYSFETEYISADILRRDYKITLDIVPEISYPPEGAVTRLIYRGGEDDIIYNMGRVPVPVPPEVFKANGIRIFKRDDVNYLNIKDIEAVFPVKIW